MTALHKHCSQCGEHLALYTAWQLLPTFKAQVLAKATNRNLSIKGIYPEPVIEWNFFMVHITMVK